MYIKGILKLSGYCATKFAVRGLTQTAGKNLFFSSFSMISILTFFQAIELKEYGITANAYAPGFIPTKLSK